MIKVTALTENYFGFGNLSDQTTTAPDQAFTVTFSPFTGAQMVGAFTQPGP